MKHIGPHFPLSEVAAKNGSINEWMQTWSAKFKENKLTFVLNFQSVN